MNIAEGIHLFRQQRKMSQFECAKKFGINSKILLRYELDSKVTHSSALKKIPNSFPSDRLVTIRIKELFTKFEVAKNL